MGGLISILLIILLYIGNDIFKIRKYPVSIINQVSTQYFRESMMGN